MNTLLEQFLNEAREHLSFIDANLQSLIDADDELVNSLFRAAHTLKGSGGLAGFEDIKNITHVAEDILDSIRNKTLEPTEDIINALYDAFDIAVELIDAAEDAGDIPESDKERINEIIENLHKFSTKQETAVDINLIIDITPPSYRNMLILM